MKRTIAMLLTLTVAVSGMIGCNASPASPATSTTSTPSSAAAAPASSSSVAAPAQPVVLKVFITPSTNKVAPDDMPFFQQLQKDLNVDLVFEAVTQNSQERISLMFASEDFPDIMLKGATRTQINEAAAGGKIVALNDLIEQYSPTWKKLLASDSMVKRMATSSDGKIWSLPLVRQEPLNSGVRDLWLINKTWLAEVGKEMPTTTDEFYEVLKAFKANAGKGSIPANAIPWAVRYNAYANGGEYEIYSSFGVFTPGNPNFISVDEEGKVAFSATNPKIKDAIHYLNKLYSEGLIAPEMFTDNVASYDSKVLADPPIAGVAMKYYGWDKDEKNWTAMPPLSGPNGERPMYRQQTNAIQRDSFVVFSNNMHLEKTMEIIEYIAQPEISLQALYGPIGTHINKVGNKYEQVALNNDMLNVVPDVCLPIVITEDMMKNFAYTGLPAQRASYIENVYKPYIAPLSRLYPPAVFTAEQATALQDVETDLLTYIKETHAKWIAYGGIDGEWDAYVKRVEGLNLKTMLDIYQQALDDFNSNK